MWSWTKKTNRSSSEVLLPVECFSRSFKEIRAKENMWKIDASEVIIFLDVWLASIIKSMNESKLIHRL